MPYEYVASYSLIPNQYTYHTHGMPMPTATSPQTEIRPHTVLQVLGSMNTISSKSFFLKAWVLYLLSTEGPLTYLKIELSRLKKKGKSVKPKEKSYLKKY